MEWGARVVAGRDLRLDVRLGSEEQAQDGGVALLGRCVRRGAFLLYVQIDKCRVGLEDGGNRADVAGRCREV